VRRGNEAALQLYKSLGFRPVGVRPNYYVDEGEDAIVMVLDF
jgi:ribosomal-protein-alanine N-acetyltransferase